MKERNSERTWPRLCKNQSCGATTTKADGYCEQHEQPHRHNVKSAQRANTALYNDPKWRRYSQGFRQKNPLCVNYDDCHGFAELVDHIKPVNEGGEFWDKLNHQSMCQSCHNRKRQRESGQSTKGQWFQTFTIFMQVLNKIKYLIISRG